MHILQPKHIKLNLEESQLVLAKLNISPLQLPKIMKKDPALPDDVNVGDIIKIERKTNNRKIVYYRVVIP